MAKRVSLKGKGADIFFGDYPPAGSTEVPAEDKSTSSPLDSDSSGQTSTRTPTEVTSPPPASPPALPTSTHRSTNAPTRARTHARTHTHVEAISPDHLWRQLQEKQRLASSTFRFRPEELEELDQVFAKVGPGRARKLSKNDLVRLGLNWLLEDYRKNGDDSVLAKVLTRT